MLQAGRIVRSIAGHDKDRFYVIVQAGKDRVTIADGRLRKLGKPKAKNVAHLRPTSASLDMEVVKTDKKLREALEPYNRALRSEEGGN